jgi:drug/metabolite transporter (DMT)-like permease
MAWGLARTPALAASLITSLEPILTPVWVALFYGERPTATALCGMVLVLLCVAWYNAACAKGTA